MDLRQIENIIAIEQEQSISKAAEKMFLTQSALNQQLLKLEKDLDIQLFKRTKHKMHPTYAGSIYLAGARQIVQVKKETYKIIQDISKENTGEIAIAYTSERGSLMFSLLYPLFHKEYPNVTFHIREAHIKKMEQMLLQKEVTLACTAYYNNIKNPALDYLDIKDELMVLGLPATHPLAVAAGEKSWETFPIFDLKLLQSERFALISKETRLRDMIDDTFEKAGFHPQILFETSNMLTVVNMVRNQVCPAFFPQSYVEAGAPMVYFSLPGQPSWRRCVSYLKGAYLTKPEKYFIQLIHQYFQGQLPDHDYIQYKN